MTAASTARRGVRWDGSAAPADPDLLPTPARRPRPGTGPAGRPARRTQPGGRPARVREGAPDLRVVPTAPATSVAVRRRRAVALTLALGFAGLLAVVGAHVRLTERQFRLEQLEQEAVQAQAQYDRNRLEVAELEAPDRIVAAAAELGMVVPDEVHYLGAVEGEGAPILDVPASPAGRSGGDPAQGRSSATAAADAPAGAGSPSTWPLVKQHLGDRP